MGTQRSVESVGGGGGEDGLKWEWNKNNSSKKYDK